MESASGRVSGKARRGGNLNSSMADEDDSAEEDGDLVDEHGVLEDSRAGLVPAGEVGCSFLAKPSTFEGVIPYAFSSCPSTGLE